MIVKSNRCHGNVTFLGKEVYTREVEGTWYIAMRPLVEALGLAWKPQYTAIKQKLGDKAILMPFRTGSGRFRRYLGLPQTELIAWASSINHNKLWSKEAVAQLLAFKEDLWRAAQLDAEGFVISARVNQLGEQYRNLPMCEEELFFLRQMTKDGKPLDRKLASLCYMFSFPKISYQLEQYLQYGMHV